MQKKPQKNKRTNFFLGLWRNNFWVFFLQTGEKSFPKWGKNLDKPFGFPGLKFFPPKRKKKNPLDNKKKKAAPLEFILLFKGGFFKGFFFLGGGFKLKCPKHQELRKKKCFWKGTPWRLKNKSKSPIFKKILKHQKKKKKSGEPLKKGAQNLKKRFFLLALGFPPPPFPRPLNWNKYR